MLSPGQDRDQTVMSVQTSMQLMAWNFYFDPEMV